MYRRTLSWTEKKGVCVQGEREKRVLLQELGERCFGRRGRKGGGGGGIVGGWMMLLLLKGCRGKIPFCRSGGICVQRVKGGIFVCGV